MCSQLTTRDRACLSGSCAHTRPWNPKPYELEFTQAISLWNNPTWLGHNADFSFLVPGLLTSAFIDFCRVTGKIFAWRRKHCELPYILSRSVDPTLFSFPSLSPTLFRSESVWRNARCLPPVFRASDQPGADIPWRCGATSETLSPGATWSNQHV